MANTRKTKKTLPNGYVIYDGPSLIDGAPIVAIAITHSTNSKTGGMVQTYIMRKDMHPLDASKTGADYAICGDCPHRGHTTTDPKRKQATERTCYVVLGQGPTQVYKAYKRGAYPQALPAQVGDLLAGRMVRIGTYGDGAAVPANVWDHLIALAAGHTGYTHQAYKPNTAFDPSLYMVSADSEQAARAAWGKGYRTFRIVADVSERVHEHEIECPSERGVQCVDCGLCAGTAGKLAGAKSVVITVHGGGAKYFEGGV